MYLVGASHPRKIGAQRLFERLVTDAEAPQEILHRYIAIRRTDFIQPAFDALLGVTDQVFPIDQSTVERAKQISLGHPHPLRSRRFLPCRYATA